MHMHSIRITIRSNVPFASFRCIWLLFVLALCFVHKGAVEAVQHPNLNTTQILALEILYNNTGGNSGTWDYTGIAGCVDTALVGIGMKWNFTKDASTGVYSHDPCAHNATFTGLNCTCTATTCDIITLALPCGKLVGTLPAELTSLTMLGTVDFSSNENLRTHPSLLDGIPSAIVFGELLYLEYLDLSSTIMSGNLSTLLLTSAPHASAHNSSLAHLNLESTAISGTIPADFCSDHTSLQYLNLQNTYVGGSLPAEIGLLKQLATLNVAQCQFTDSIPPSLYTMTNLTSLDLSSNALTGGDNGISQIGSLFKLQHLSLASNNINDTIPSTIGNLASLTFMSLYSCNIVGKISEELGNNVLLEHLDLSSNHLTSTLPTKLGNLVQLKKMFLYQNSLMGGIPKELGALVKLEELALYENYLTSTIPKELCINLTLLQWLDLAENQLVGSIGILMPFVHKRRRWGWCHGGLTTSKHAPKGTQTPPSSCLRS